MFNLTLKDLRALFRPLLLLAAVVTVAAIATIYTSGLVANAKSEVATRERALNDARTRVQQSGQEINIIERYVQPYRQLEATGIVGDEQRVSWIEALRAANREADLYGVEYDVGPRQNYSFMSEAGAGSLAVHQSLMKVKFGLLHEGDLFRFFHALAAQNAGSFSVNQCKVTPLPVNLSVPVNQPTLNAECDVAWITIAGPAQTEERS